MVYDPSRNDLFTATRGRGAYLNDRRIRVAKRDRLADGLIGTGFPFRETDGLEAYGRQFAEMTEACAGLRRPGAAALDLANVAAGRMDGFFEQGLNPWDVAAGSLLITEAGGLVGKDGHAFCAAGMRQFMRNSCAIRSRRGVGATIRVL